MLFGIFAYRSYLGEHAATFDRIGADARINYGNLSLAGGYINGWNDLTKEEKHIWFGEASYFVAALADALLQIRRPHRGKCRQRRPVQGHCRYVHAGDGPISDSM